MDINGEGIEDWYLVQLIRLRRQHEKTLMHQIFMHQQILFFPPKHLLNFTFMAFGRHTLAFDPERHTFYVISYKLGLRAFLRDPVVAAW